MQPYHKTVMSALVAAGMLIAAGEAVAFSHPPPGSVSLPCPVLSAEVVFDLALAAATEGQGRDGARGLAYLALDLHRLKKAELASKALAALRERAVRTPAQLDEDLRQPTPVMPLIEVMTGTIDQALALIRTLKEREREGRGNIFQPDRIDQALNDAAAASAIVDEEARRSHLIEGLIAIARSQPTPTLQDLGYAAIANGLKRVGDEAGMRRVAGLMRTLPETFVASYSLRHSDVLTPWSSQYPERWKREEALRLLKEDPPEAAKKSPGAEIWRAAQAGDMTTALALVDKVTPQYLRGAVAGLPFRAMISGGNIQATLALVADHLDPDYWPREIPILAIERIKAGDAEGALTVIDWVEDRGPVGWGKAGGAFNRDQGLALVTWALIERQAWSQLLRLTRKYRRFIESENRHHPEEGTVLGQRMVWLLLEAVAATLPVLGPEATACLVLDAAAAALSNQSTANNRVPHGSLSLLRNLAFQLAAPGSPPIADDGR